MKGKAVKSYCASEERNFNRPQAEVLSAVKSTTIKVIIIHPSLSCAVIITVVILQRVVVHHILAVATRQPSSLKPDVT
jgi:hypothetical protein